MTTIIATIRKSRIVQVAACCLLLAGCATPQAPVQVVGDSYCQAAKKKTWSVNDTPETIEQIVRHNAGVDRACGVKATS